MIAKLNHLIEEKNPDMKLSYSIIKKEYAHELVRERHMAKALRELALTVSILKRNSCVFLKICMEAKNQKRVLKTLLHWKMR